MKNSTKPGRAKKPANLPELLLPAGNPDSFMAAISGGADAIYFGLNQFNARSRARNFQLEDIPSLAKEAKKRNVKLYLTLNTLIKNGELRHLLKLLSALEHLPVSALIIQDWGLYYLVKKYFPKLVLHSSTQMGIHNSLDANFHYKLGFSRSILARELSLSDLKLISNRSQAELEIFVHGALCYSFSGYCLMSSFIGGNSANRGLCRQPCRQIYQTAKESNMGRFFCMKDYQLIDFLPQICELGIRSLKIEGRMRSPEYVYQVARAYRMALDDFEKIPQAKQILAEDGGRDKTTWRFSGSEESPITERAQTAIKIGSVTDRKDGFIQIKLCSDWKQSATLFYSTGDYSSLLEFTHTSVYRYQAKELVEISSARAGDTILVKDRNRDCQIASEVYRLPHALNSRFKWNPRPIPTIRTDLKRIEGIYRQLTTSSVNTTPKSHIYVRISDPAWLPLLSKFPHLRVIYPLHLAKDLKDVSALIIETPLYTKESRLKNLRSELGELQKRGATQFSISRLSHLEYLDRRNACKIFTNEFVYSLNDASIAHISGFGISSWVLPLENDFPNVMASSNRNGIVPIYYSPPLFLSMQKTETDDELVFPDQHLVPQRENQLLAYKSTKAVCLFGFLPRLAKLHYHKFLIDLSNKLPSAILLDLLMDYYAKGKALPDTTTFNFKKGLH